MTDTHRTRLTRIADARLARRAADDSAAAVSPAAARAGAGPLAPGDRVFDTITGQEGTIRSVATPSNARVPLAAVTLDGGADVTRWVDLIYARPPRPPAR